ncbi:MAG TPA: hypothetical protein VGI45_28690 [Terracidiphilus sp.]|jgi:hypothetical protein
MVQILWKSSEPHSPAKDHDLVELRLVDLGETMKSRYLVREIHAFWSASGQQIEWKGYKDHRFGTPQEAHLSFVTRKAVIANAGFEHTTVLD